MHAIAPELWQLHGPDFRIPLGGRMPLYTTIARLPDRTLAIYSPCNLDDEAAAAIEREGEVAHVIAPNLYHHLFAGKALARWPKATLHAPAGLAAKRPDLPALRPLGAPDPAWGGVFEAVTIAGAPKMNETVLFHRSSGTLVCGDFVFNVTEPANAMTKLALKMMGVGTRALAQSRAWTMLSKDRPATAASFAQILAWPITQVAPVHGPATAIDAATLGSRLRIS